MMLQILPAPDVDPRLIAANTILQLSTVDLEQAIVQELDDNPALEMAEQIICPTCGGMLRAHFCTRCSGIEFPTMESHSNDPSSTTWEDSSLEDADPFGTVPTPLTLAEHLFAQLRLILDERDYPIALYLVGNLDEHGYLTLTVEKIAQSLHVATERVRAVLQELQDLEPVGTGAQSVTECLLLQLKRLTKEGLHAPPITETIIQHHLAELGRHQFDHLRTVLRVTRAEIEAAFLFIRANLHPYPAHHHYTLQNSTPTRSQLVPSVLIHHNASSAGGYDVEIIESQRLFLRLNPIYQSIRQHPELAYSPKEYEHVTLFLERARLFISQLQRRSQLLHKVMLYLINYQRDFLDHGLLHLRPLTQKMVAQALNIHASIISRTLTDKFALLPSRELIPLHLFFSAEALVQERIRHIIANESQPLSDAQIARLLQEDQNITLSRQMVANYRMGLGIPAARQRAVLHRGGTL